jgi:type II secretory pathway pseudopilin PulG
MSRRGAFTILELIIVIAIFTLTFTLLTPLVDKIKERAHVIRCSNNVRVISLALHAYAADHNEAFPDSLDALYPRYLKSEKVFSCPAAHFRSPGAPKINYEYVAGLTESSPGTEAMLYDRDNNHGRLGRNIVRVNGSVEWARGASGKPR